MKKLPIRIAALLAVSSIPLAAAGESAPPNVVFIISDDQAWNDYGFMGHEKIDTPRLDALAAESLTFRRGYTPVPLCRSSLATIATGLYPHQHGVTGNDPEIADKGVNAQTQRSNPKYAPLYEAIVANFERQPNLVRNLTKSGYSSLQTGKWWEGDPREKAGFSHAMTAGTGRGDRHGGAGLAIGREGLQPIRDFLEEEKGKPFLIWYAPFLPHAPHTPPEDLLEKYLKLAPTKAVARYWACVEWFDRTCGELIDLLESEGLRENTIIVYVCDNGWLQQPDKIDQFAPRSKLTPYEGGVRTPIMVSWPGKLKPRMDAEHLASSIDLWPTVASLLEMKAPDGLPGIDLTDPEAVAARSAIFGEQYRHNIGDVKRPAASLENRWVIVGGWKLISPDAANLPDAKPELYNLAKDPWEKEELSGDQPDRVKAMAALLDEWWLPGS